MHVQVTHVHATQFLVAENTVSRSLSDGIHVTAGSSYGRVLNNSVKETGDDMIAVVSYVADPGTSADAILADFDTRRANALSHHITIANNTSFTNPGQPTTLGNGHAPVVAIGGTMVELTAAAPGGVVLDAGGGLINLTSGGGLPAPTVVIGGSLLTARNAMITNGDPLANTNTFLFIADGSILSIVLTGGSGITLNPTITIAPPVNTATATAVLNGATPGSLASTIQSISITDW